MTITHQPYPGVDQAKVADQGDSDEISWQEVRALGLDPAPFGLTEDSETQQG